MTKGKGFLTGMVVGAIAVGVYEMGVKAKNSLGEGKDKIKRKFDKIFN